MNLKRSRLSKYFLYMLIVVFSCYVLLETGFTVWERVYGEPFFYLVEDAGDTPFKFDPVSGYRIGSSPHRIAGFRNTTIEFQSRISGNSQGFNDSQDFIASKDGSLKKRVIVFGDSYSSAMHLSVNWPNRADIVCQSENIPIEFFNFSLDGIGLANWWSMIKGIVEKENYEADAIVFALHLDNLERPFRFWDSQRYHRCLIGQTKSWDPSTFPKTLMEARSLMQKPPIYVLPTEEFDNLLDRKSSPFRLALIGNYRSINWVIRAVFTNRSVTSDPYRRRMIEEIGEFVKQKSLKSYVFIITQKPEGMSEADLVGWTHYTFPETVTDIQEFAKTINATLVDSTEMFKGKTAKESLELYGVTDPHYNQKGSDKFADLVLDRLKADLVHSNADGQ